MFYRKRTMTACDTGNIIQTRNGVSSLATPDSSGSVVGRLSLYFKAGRGLNVPQLYHYLRKSSHEDIVDTFVLVFYLRDCRSGKGERELGRHALRWLFLNYPEHFMKVAHLVPHYGRWDDILRFWPGVLNLHYTNPNPTKEQRKAWIEYINRNFYSNIQKSKRLREIQGYQEDLVRLMGSQLIEDRKQMDSAQPTSLCAKWAPTEKDSLDQRHKVVRMLCSIMAWTPATYRKVYTSPLRDYLQVTETFMCKKDWDRIDFNTVPSCAMKRLKKAFEKHCPHALRTWKRGLTTGNNKVNAKQLFPHELICEVGSKGIADPICQARWMVLEEQSRKLGALEDALVVADVSSSMTSWGAKNKHNFAPIDVAMGLGILISSVTKGVFHNKVITFSAKPSFVELEGKDIFERYNKLRNAGWAGHTNLQATFDLILDLALKSKLESKELPKRIFIISDMQFDRVEGENDNERVNFQVINAKYKAVGYERPQLVFWNVGNESDDFPVSSGVGGTALVSGFSPSIMKSILQGGEISPWSITKKVLTDDRYGVIRQCLS
jgi:hypothetical protein